jgi:hypothetical protein
MAGEVELLSTEFLLDRKPLDPWLLRQVPSSFNGRTFVPLIITDFVRLMALAELLKVWKANISICLKEWLTFSKSHTDSGMIGTYLAVYA